MPNLFNIPQGGFTPATERFIIMRFILRVSAWIDWLNEWVGRGTAWVTLLLVAVVFIDVVMRYVFNRASFSLRNWSGTLRLYFLDRRGLHPFHDGHVRVDIIYQRLALRARPG